MPAGPSTEILAGRYQLAEVIGRGGMGDVKPANVLITEDGRPMLADFGIAKMAEGTDHTLAGLIIGTPAYLAPERLAGGVATPGTDLYSLAVMLYEALSARSRSPATRHWRWPTPSRHPRRPRSPHAAGDSTPGWRRRLTVPWPGSRRSASARRPRCSSCSAPMQRRLG